jgi:peptidoglycan/LPS O-acetylase OafA/YrhL
VTHHKHPHLTHPKYRPDIDGLRAVAILAVVLFHAFPKIMPGGFIGVDIFFVISGFLISTIIFSSLERDRFSLSEFYARRIRRIFPALILVLVSCLVLGWFVLSSDQYKQLGKHAAAGAGFIQNFVLLSESGNFSNTAKIKLLVHLWSLAIEEQFYIFWPLLLLFVWKRHYNFLRVTALIAAISFAVNIYLIQTGQLKAAFMLPFSRFWELMLGSVLAYIVLHRPQFIEKHKDAQSFLGFALIIAGLLLLNKGRDFPGWWALLPTLGAYFIISASPASWLNEKLLSSKLMVWIGLISYPLYLWHWPIFMIENILFSEQHIANRIVSIAIAVLLAWLTYKFLEMSIRVMGKSLRVTFILLGLLVSVAGFGLYSSCK